MNQSLNQNTGDWHNLISLARLIHPYYVRASGINGASQQTARAYTTEIAMIVECANALCFDLDRRLSLDDLYSCI
jgi:hypothetical protein